MIQAKSSPVKNETWDIVIKLVFTPLRGEIMKEEELQIILSCNRKHWRVYGKRNLVSKNAESKNVFQN